MIQLLLIALLQQIASFGANPGALDMYVHVPTELPDDAPVVVVLHGCSQTATSMDHLVRNADGDDLLFLHHGAGDLHCDYGHLALVAGDYVVIPRGTMWRIETKQPLAALLVEATNSSYALPDKGILGGHAIFDPAMLDVPKMDAAFVAQQSDDRAWQRSTGSPD